MKVADRYEIATRCEMAGSITLRAFVRLSSAILLLAVWACVTRPTPGMARPFPEAERAFHQESRWLGGDAALSIALGPERTLWLFGDSFIAPPDASGRSASTLVRNSVAIQTGSDLTRATMHFVWPRAMSNDPSSFFPERGARWRWPGHGVRLEQGPLMIFLYEIEAAPGQGLGFREVGYAIALIDDPDSPPEQWAPQIIEAPAVPFDAAPATAAIVDGEHLVALAIRQHGTHAGFLVRYPTASLAAGDISSAQWWAGEDRGWLSADQLGPAGPTAVLDDAGAECSLHWDARLGAYMHVASYGFGASVIGVRTAPALTGPWGATRIVYRPPESDGPRPFVYAAKAHPEVSTGRADELVITYAANSFEFGDLLTARGEAELYWPRVVRLNLRQFRGGGRPDAKARRS